MKKLKLAIVGILVVMCAAFAVGCGNSSPKACFNGFLSGMTAVFKSEFKEKDCEKVAGAFGPKDSAEYKKVMGGLTVLKGLYTLGGNLGGLFGGDSDAVKTTVKLKVLSFEATIAEDGNSATATAKIKSEVKTGDKDPVVEESEMKLIPFKKIDKKWYLGVDAFEMLDFGN